jgi:hypothetical protein
MEGAAMKQKLAAVFLKFGSLNSNGFMDSCTMTMTMILMNLAAILLVYEIKIQQHVHYI